MDVSFAGLLWWGVAVAGVALVILVVVIPAMSCLTKESNTKTEFYSSSASYWCVITGLVLMVISGIGRTVAQIILTARGK